MRRRWPFPPYDTGSGPTWAVAAASLLMVAAVTTPTRVEATTQPASDVTVVDQTFTLRAGGTLNLVLDVGDTMPTAGSTVEVAVHGVIIDAAQFAAIDAGSVPPASDVSAVPVDEAALGGDGQLSLAIPVGAVGTSAEDSLDPGSPGVHALSVTIVEGATHGRPTVTYVESVDPAAVRPNVPFAVLAGAADPGPLPSVDEQAAGLEQLQALVSLSERVDGPLTLWLPPSLLATGAPSIDPTVPADAPPAPTPETDGDPTPGSGSGSGSGSAVTNSTLSNGPAETGATRDGDLPTQLITAFVGDEVVARPAVDLDPSAVIAVDRLALFTNQLRRGEDLVAASSPEPVVSRSAWVTDRPLSQDAAVVLRNVGIRTVVMSADVAGGLTPVPTRSVFDIGLGNNGDLPAITLSPLGSQLDVLPAERDGDGPPSSPVVHAARLAAELLVDQAVSGAPGYVLASTDIGLPDPEVTASLARFAAQSDLLDLQPLSSLSGPIDRAAASSPVVSLPTEAGVDLSSRLADIDAARNDARDAASMLVEPSPSNPWADDLDRLLAAGLTDAQVQTELGTIDAQTARVLDAVVPPEPSTLTLTGSSSTLRLRVENTGDIPLEVLVRARSPKLRFPEPAEPKVVPAQSAQEFDIPIIARSNGTFTIEVDLLTPDGSRRLAPAVVLKARVTRLTGLSRVVSAGAVLVLVSWWYSHLRRNRRRRAAVLATGAGSDPLAGLSPDAAEARD